MRDEQNNPKRSEIDTDSAVHSTLDAAEPTENEAMPAPPALSRPAQYAETRPADTQLPAAPTTPLSGESALATAVSTGGAAPLGDLNRAPQWRAKQPCGEQSAPPTAEREEDNGRLKPLLRETVETVVLAVLIFLVIRALVQNYRIEGQSMEPNFHHGQYLLVNKLVYRLGEYTRGDVIIFQYPNNPAQDYIKRVIGLPDDTVEIRNGVLFVNGSSIDEPYDHIPMVRNMAAQTVEPGSLFVLGDNRPASSDTRTWGQLDQDFVIGKAWLAIWPLEEFGLVEHPAIEVGPVMERGP